MARLRPVSEQFRVARQATLAKTQALLVATAKREHARVLQAAPQPSGFLRIVDGKPGAPEEAVRANGRIVYRYDRIAMVVQYAMEVLFDKSPVESGDYRSGHTIFLNDAAVANLEGYKSGDEVVICNFVPYSRKIEAGIMEMTVPGTDHVYEQAAQMVMQRFGNVATVRFTYVGVGLGGATKFNSRGNRSERKAANASQNRYPALTFRVD